MYTQILSLIDKIIVYVRDAVINIRLAVQLRRGSAGAYRERFVSRHTFLFLFDYPPPSLLRTNRASKRVFL